MHKLLNAVNSLIITERSPVGHLEYDLQDFFLNCSANFLHNMTLIIVSKKITIQCIGMLVQIVFINKALRAEI